MIYVLNTEKEWKEYNDYVCSHPECTIYNTVEWKNVLEATFNIKPYYLVNKVNNRIVATLSLFKTGTVFSIKLQGIPLSFNAPPLCDDTDYLHEMEDWLLRNRKKTRLEIRDIYKNNLYQYLKPVGINTETIIDLTKTADEIFSDYTSSNRRSIRRAMKSPLEIKQINVEDLPDFYALMVDTRHRQGAPVYPILFFYNMIYFLRENNLSLYGIYNENILVASILLFFYGNRALYAYGCSSSNPKFLNMRPNNYLLHHAIMQSKAMGKSIFSFGSTPIEHKSLLKFKQGFGGKTIDIFYFNNDNVKINESKIKDFSKIILQKLPRNLYKLSSNIAFNYFL